MKKGKLIMVTGGCRSGKSRFALSLTDRFGAPCYIATGWTGDAEMRERIRYHQAERGPHWMTIEERIDLADAFSLTGGRDAVLLDCLTAWVTNLMFERDVNSIQLLLPYLSSAVAAARECGLPVVLVTNEVGCGLVPSDAPSRTFRDLAGWANQRFAEAADEVWVTLSGIPLKIKGSSEKR